MNTHSFYSYRQVVLCKFILDNNVNYLYFYPELLSFKRFY